MTRTGTANARTVTVITALAVAALAGLLVNGFGAAFIDALGQVARTIALQFGATKEVAMAVEIGAEALGRIAKVLWL